LIIKNSYGAYILTKKGEIYLKEYYKRKG